MFDLFTAFQQGGYLFAAISCLFITLLILGYALYWYLHADRGEGQIIGVRRDAGGNSFYSVYRFRYTDGAMHEATSNIGSANLSNRRTGTIVPLYVARHNPEDVYEADALKFVLAAALIPGMVGAAFLHATFTLPVTIWTLLVAAAYIGFGFYKLFDKYAQNANRDLTLAQNYAVFRQKLKERKRPAYSVRPIERAEDIRPDAAAQERKSTKNLTPILLIATLGLLGGAGFVGYRTFTMEQGGIRTPGHVVRLDKSRTHDKHGTHYNYRAVVEFMPPGQGMMTFTDKTGSNPPSYQPGQDVTVLYLPSDPQGHAMIDHGKGNWFLPGLFAVMGLAAFMVFLKMAFYRARLKRQEIESGRSGL